MKTLIPISGCEQAERKADVVFIHGPGSDGATPRRPARDPLDDWPLWLGREYPDVGVWRLPFSWTAAKKQRTRLFANRRSYGGDGLFSDNAAQACDGMLQAGIGRRPLLVIALGLGGLVAKQILRMADECDGELEPLRKKLVQSTRAVLFVSTPHTGTALSWQLDSYRSASGSTVSMEMLRTFDAYRPELFDWYRRRSLALGLETISFYELYGEKYGRPLATPLSAHPGIGADPIPLDDDTGSGDGSIPPDALFREAIHKLIGERILPPETGSDRSAPVPAVPGQFPLHSERFYGRSRELNRILHSLKTGQNCIVAGMAGIGKSALAAEALRILDEESSPSALAGCFADGVVWIDLVRYRGHAEPVWDALANSLAGSGFMADSWARDRAVAACRSRRALIVIDNGELADGLNGRSDLTNLCSVMSQANRFLLLTRNPPTGMNAEVIELTEALDEQDAAVLFDSFNRGKLGGKLRCDVLTALSGHPLAITWAGAWLTGGEEQARSFLKNWPGADAAEPQDRLLERRLSWLLEQLVGSLDDTLKRTLSAAAMLARLPFPLEAVAAAVNPDISDLEPVGNALLSLQRHGLISASVGADCWEFTSPIGYSLLHKGQSDPLLRERLGRWFHDRLRISLASETDPDIGEELPVFLEHGAALLNMDRSQSVWTSLANFYLYEGYYRVHSIGRSDLVRLVFTAVSDWLDLFPPSKAQLPEWMREHAVLLNRRGDVYSDHGDPSRALQAYRQALDISRTLTQADPGKLDWQRDMSVCHSKTGDALTALGDLPAALQAYRDSLSVSRRLADADVTNPAWLQDQSVTQERIGDTLRSQSNLDEALQAYQASLDISRRLAQSDPKNGYWQRNLRVSYRKIGDLLCDLGELVQARQAYDAALSVSRCLVENDPDNPVWLRDLSVSQERIGDVLAYQGDLAGAQEAYRSSLAVRKRLTESDPANLFWQRDLSVSQERIGDVLRSQGDLAGAREIFDQSLLVSRNLVNMDPDNIDWQRELSISCCRMGDVLSEMGNLTGSLSVYQEALSISRMLTRLDPADTCWQRDFYQCQRKIGDVLCGLGELADAQAAYMKSLAASKPLAEADPNNPSWQRDLSAIYNRIADVYRYQGDHDGALQAYTNALAASKRLAEADPSQVAYQRDYSFCLTRLAEYHEQRGDVAAALRMAQQSLSLDEHLAAMDSQNPTWQQDVSVSRALVARLRAQSRSSIATVQP